MRVLLNRSSKTVHLSGTTLIRKNYTHANCITSLIMNRPAAISDGTRRTQKLSHSEHGLSLRTTRPMFCSYLDEKERLAATLGIGARPVQLRIWEDSEKMHQPRAVLVFPLRVSTHDSPLGWNDSVHFVGSHGCTSWPANSPALSLPSIYLLPYIYTILQLLQLRSVARRGLISGSLEPLSLNGRSLRSPMHSSPAISQLEV